jgi:hypothetical protein
MRSLHHITNQGTTYCTWKAIIGTSKEEQRYYTYTALYAFGIIVTPSSFAKLALRKLKLIYFHIKTQFVPHKVQNVLPFGRLISECCIGRYGSVLSQSYRTHEYTVLANTVFSVKPDGTYTSNYYAYHAINTISRANVNQLAS